MKAIDIWRAAVTIGDYRRGLRLISGHPRLDVCLFVMCEMKPNGSYFIKRTRRQCAKKMAHACT